MDVKRGVAGEAAGFVCPDSRDTLGMDGDNLKSPFTGRVFPVHEGIPDFRKYPTSEDETQRAKLKKLIEVCEQKGWLEALETVVPETVHYVVNEERAKFLDYLPLTKQSRVLEIGASLGEHTYLIAERCQFVHALEVVPEQAQFAAKRCAQMGVSNVQLACGGDDCRLPYRSGMFDLVVTNLVFEWCGMRCVEERFSDAQRRLLEESHRVLAPGGSLFLATKNRFSLRLLLGAKDEHACQLRFGSALPRWVLSLALRGKDGSGPRGLLHSYRALKKLMTGAGFDEVGALWALPDARYPVEYVPMNRASLKGAKKKYKDRTDIPRLPRLMLKYLPFSLFPWVGASHVFLAHKAENASESSHR